MRHRWKLFVAVLLVGGAAGILTAVAFAQASISIDSARAQVTYDRGDDDDERTSVITSGPMGAGYDIRIQADVTDTTWRATRWSTSGVSHCIDHDNQSAGSNREVFLNYYFQKAALLRESPKFPVPSSVGNNEHVFPPPPGASSVLTLELFNTGDCSGSPLATRPVNLTTDPLTPPNPPLLAGCQGMQVAVVLDESGSIATAGATQDVKDATKALAQGLVGTGATMAVFKFSTVASSSSISPYQTVTQSFVDVQLTNYLSNYDPEGYTNWDSGLRKALIADRPDLVIFMTDGNPNRYGNGGDSGIPEGYYTPMEPAAGVANQIKQTSHMFVIGVGDGVTDSLSALRIQAVSGIKSFPTYPISTADYTLVTDFDELEEALRNIASNLCNVTVTVKKETDESGPWISRSGWRFTGRVELAAPASPFAYQWYEPNRVTSVNTGSATQPGTTNTAGILRFVWRPTAANALSNITISEPPVPGVFPDMYTPVSVSCTSGGGTIYTSDVPAVAESFTLPGLKVRDDVQCVVRNRLKRSTVKVVKNWVGPPSSATIFVDATGAAPYDASTTPANMSGDNASFNYPLSTPVRVGETVVPSGYSATIQCGQSPEQAYAGGPFPVTSPAVDKGIVTCTITNTQLRSHVAVVKRWVGATGSATIFVDPDGAPPYDASAVAGPSGTSASFTYPISTPTAVGETVPTGYSATVQCGQSAAQPYTGGPFPVTSPDIGGATLTCTITNTQQLSSVRVIKNWVTVPASATIFVDADGVAPYDASTVAPTDGDNAVFTYQVSTGVFVGETSVPVGYTATIQCGSAPPVVYTGGPFGVTSPATAGDTITCTINNVEIPAPPVSTVRVVKDWVGAASSAEIFVDADGVAPYDASATATLSGDNVSFDYTPGTSVTVGETVVPPGYSATIDCGLGRQAYTGGPIAVTSPVIADSTLTCTITNTQMFSHVRVVKNWDGPPSSTTIFVDADGVAPYDASTVATASGQSAVFTYPVNTPVTVGEDAVPAGYRATIHCGLTREAPQPYAGGAFPVTSPDSDGETVTCTITNIQLRSTVQVVKEWAGGASTATLFVDADGAAPYDSSTVSTASGEGASFTYPISTPATVGETVVPSGFTATIDCGSGPQVYTGGPFGVTSPPVDGAALTCTIINTPQTTVRVEKQWAGRPTAATIFVDGAGQSPYDVSTLAEADGQSASFDYPPSTRVTLGEIAVPTGYVAFINCGTGPQDLRRYTGGPFIVTTPSTAEGVLTCTVANAKRVTPGRLVIAKKVNRRVVRGSGQVRFTVTVRNEGPGTAQAVRTCDRLPKGLVLVRAPGAQRVNGSLCWTVRSLPPRGKRSYLVVARVVGGTRKLVFVNVAQVGGVNTPNCPRIAALSRRLRAGCNAGARVTVLVRRRIQVRRAVFTFTG